jgi:hypothetical protein
MIYYVDILHTTTWTIQASGRVMLTYETSEWLKKNCKGTFMLTWENWPFYRLAFSNEEDRNWFVLRWS